MKLKCQTRSSCWKTKCHVPLFILNGSFRLVFFLLKKKLDLFRPRCFPLNCYPFWLSKGFIIFTRFYNQKFFFEFFYLFTQNSLKIHSKRLQYQRIAFFNHMFFLFKFLILIIIIFFAFNTIETNETRTWGQIDETSNCFALKVKVSCLFSHRNTSRDTWTYRPS